MRKLRKPAVCFPTTVKAMKTNLTQKGKSPRPSVHDITENDEFYDGDNADDADDIPQLPHDQPSANEMKADQASSAAVVTMQNDDVMIVEDFVATDAVSAHVSGAV